MERSLKTVLNEWLQNPEISDICINRHDEVFIHAGDGFVLASESPSIFRSEIEYRNLILEEISKSGKTWDAKLPFVDTVFFGTHRAHVCFPPLTPTGIALSLRKLPGRSRIHPAMARKESRTRWQSSEVAFSMLMEAVQNRETLMIAGATGSGKTTLMNDLTGFIDEKERVITLEDTAELSPQHPHWLSLLTRSANADGLGEVKLRELLKQTMRMRPDRILVGECRGDEVMDLLQALNTGHQGTISTLHANSAREALKRIELLALIAARGTLNSPFIRELIAKGIQKIVHLKDRKIDSILQIEGFEREMIYTREWLSRSTVQPRVFSGDSSIPEKCPEKPSVALPG